ncbi:MAG: ATP-binding cassette domain-containing protein, partial [Actinomycetota bacterium]
MTASFADAETSPGLGDPRSDDTVNISVRDLHLKYKVYAERAYSIRELVAGGFRQRRSTYVHALKGIDLDVHRGEAIGIVGSNGSGKSTLLRTMGGLLTPSSGEVLVRAQPRLL